MSATMCRSVAVVSLLSFLANHSQAVTQRTISTNLEAQSIDFSSLGTLVAKVVAGDPNGSPPDSPSLRVDANTTASPFAGVGSLFVDAAPTGDGSGFLGTASAIHGFSVGKTNVTNYILTAAHNVDFEGGMNSLGQPTGDGVLDVSPQDVSFMLNFGSNISHVINAAEIFLHPDWHGFDNILGPEGASVNDDIAVIRLNTRLPVGVPTYNLATTDSGNAEVITTVGYGTTGDPSGYLLNSASFDTKRVGLNQLDAVDIDDEGSLVAEVFAADFDGPDGSTNVFDLGAPGFDASLEGTLGNNVETSIGGGDSGGPSFLSDFSTGELLLGPNGTPTILGINTFGSSDSPAYSSIYGGSYLPAYASWVDSVITAVPEPSTFLLLTAAVLSTRCLRLKSPGDE